MSEIPPEELPTSWDVDEVPREQMERLRQYEPTEEELKKIEEEREPIVTTSDKIAAQIANYVEELSRREIIYELNAGRQQISPFKEGEGTPKVDNPSFIYWAFKDNGVQLLEDNYTHNTRTIKNSPNLTTVYNIGSNINTDSLVRGDLLFFNKDRHIGIYTGEGSFASMIESAHSSGIGGVEIKSIEDGYWNNLFTGHVERFTG